MVVKTKFSKKELIKILSDYKLGKLIKSKYFKQGCVQTNIFLKTTNGKFVLRCYKHRTEGYILFEVNTLNYLCKHNYPCAAPIRDVYGNLVRKYRNKRFTIFKYLEGHHIKNPNKKQQVEIVKYLARLHHILKGHKPKYFEFRESHDKKYCIDTAKKESKKFKSKTKAIERLRYLQQQLKILRFPNPMPKGVAHCDYDISNIKFKGNKIKGVLDFDDSCYTYLIFDIGALIYYWAWIREKRLNFKKARFLVEQYNKYRKLSKVEKEHIFDSLKMVILTYMAWFFYDKWKSIDVFEDSKGKLEELDKIGRKEFYKQLFS